MNTTEQFHDDLIGSDSTGLPDRFFDRFVFNLHAERAGAPSLLLGFGLYPARNTADGFVIVSTETEQRNLRYSTELDATDWRGAGPFRFEVVEPMRAWRLAIADNPTGVELDVVWRARTPAWWGSVAVTNSSAESTSFDHLFQSGRYEGALVLDGQKHDVTGWYGQRDRSRGVRTMSGGQGLHIWFQAQFPDHSVGFLLVESRDQSRLLLEGAVMAEDGTLDVILDVAHDLTFDENLDLVGGRVRVTCASGRVHLIDADATATRGGYMAGGGYGGHHGRPMGRDHVEHDVYPLDGSVTQRTLDSSLTDRLTAFGCNGAEGSGIFEFALSRSSSYSYRPTLA